MKMRTKRRKKTRITSRLASLAWALAALFSQMSGPAASAAEKKTKAAESYGLIAVTVFREPGFALPGAELTLTLAPTGGGAKQKRKATSDARGEYVFRVPVQAQRYSVGVSAKGLVPQEKMVQAEGEQRIDVTFLLAAESKQ